VITIKVKYQDLSTSLDLTVWDGQENREAEVAKLRRDASQPGLTFEEHRTRAMKLLEATPGDWTIWWHLGERALGQVPEEEAAGYFTESVELARSLVEKNIASNDPEVRKRGLAELPGLEQQERAARAMLTLIPAFYENPERTILRLNWDDKRAELVERPPENEAATTVLRSVSFASRGAAAVP
jgi:hypothetical protein